MVTGESPESARCEQQTIPDLRYYFVIFKNDKYRAEKAYSFLDDAFESKNADTKTYQLVFEKNIRSLRFGVHELPIGLLVSKEEFTEIVRQCERIIKNGYGEIRQKIQQLKSKLNIT